MFKRMLITIFIIALVSCVLIQTYIHLIPKQGKILRYENFRGYSVPIIADGKGGTYRWMKDVPWNTFTIEEKFTWAKVNGGYLSKTDMEEIRQKYEVK